MNSSRPYQHGKVMDKKAYELITGRFGEDVAAGTAGYLNVNINYMEFKMSHGMEIRTVLDFLSENGFEVKQTSTNSIGRVYDPPAEKEMLALAAAEIDEQMKKGTGELFVEALNGRISTSEFTSRTRYSFRGAAEAISWLYGIEMPSSWGPGWIYELTEWDSHPEEPIGDYLKRCFSATVRNEFEMVQRGEMPKKDLFSTTGRNYSEIAARLRSAGYSIDEIRGSGVQGRARPGTDAAEEPDWERIREILEVDEFLLRGTTEHLKRLYNGESRPEAFEGFSGACIEEVTDILRHYGIDFHLPAGSILSTGKTATEKGQPQDREQKLSVREYLGREFPRGVPDAFMRVQDGSYTRKDFLAATGWPYDTIAGDLENAGYTMSEIEGTGKMQKLSVREFLRRQYPGRNVGKDFGLLIENRMSPSDFERFTGVRPDDVFRTLRLEHYTEREIFGTRSEQPQRETPDFQKPVHGRSRGSARSGRGHGLFQEREEPRIETKRRSPEELAQLERLLRTGAITSEYYGRVTAGSLPEGPRMEPVRQQIPEEAKKHPVFRPAEPLHSLMENPDAIRAATEKKTGTLLAREQPDRGRQHVKSVGGLLPGRIYEIAGYGGTTACITVLSHSKKNGIRVRMNQGATEQEKTIQPFEYGLQPNAKGNWRTDIWVRDPQL
jgi:hypothetical protein